MEVHDPLIPIFLLFLTLVSYASSTPVTVDYGAHQLVSRGIVSPSNAELLHNTIAFGVFAWLAFILRV
jgi:hypothetical protein